MTGGGSYSELVSTFGCRSTIGFDIDESLSAKKAGIIRSGTIQGNFYDGSFSTSCDEGAYIYGFALKLGVCTLGKE